MRQVDRETITRQLHGRCARGHHVDGRLIEQIKVSENLFVITLKDEASFLSLIWQEIDPTRILTPAGERRTLRDVAQRMIANSWTFETLAAPMDIPPELYDPEAFRSFVQIDSAFDFAEFGSIAVMPATDSERTQSPSGTFYIYDGVHRSLVLAHRLLNKKTVFQPVEVLLLTPRRK